MIELTVKLKNEIDAYDLSTFIAAKGLSSEVAVKNGATMKKITIRNRILNGFLKEKAVARIVPNEKTLSEPKITNKHIR